MRNALVLLVETTGETLSENTLGRGFSLELARNLCDYFTDLSISELYPVNDVYDFFLLNYKPEEAIRLQKRIGDSFRFFMIWISLLGSKRGTISISEASLSAGRGYPRSSVTLRLFPR